MTRVTLGKSRMWESRTSGSVRAKAGWLSYSPVTLSDGLAAVEAACLEALRDGVHSADVILNILARRREPPVPAAVTAPEGLRLRVTPTADCGRYDRLRSAA